MVKIVVRNVFAIEKVDQLDLYHSFEYGNTQKDICDRVKYLMVALQPYLCVKMKNNVIIFFWVIATHCLITASSTKKHEVLRIKFNVVKNWSLSLTKRRVSLKCFTVDGEDIQTFPARVISKTPWEVVIFTIYWHTSWKWDKETPARKPQRCWKHRCAWAI